MTHARSVSILGFWRAPGSPLGWPHPADLPRSRLERADRQRLLEHLRGGTELAAWMGYSYCRFADCPTLPNEMGCRDLSDGAWMWPEGLAHYVEVHDVSLPEAFVEAALRGDTTPIHEDDEPIEDGSAWIRWCAANTPAPPPDSDPASLVEAHALAARLETAARPLTIEPASGRWHIEGSREDFVPIVSLNRLEAYLMHRRWPAKTDALSVARARAIVEETYGARSVFRRAVDLLTGSAAPRPRILEAHEEPSQSGVAWWKVRSGTMTTTMPALDELGLRYELRWARELGTYLGSGARERERRLFPVHAP